MAPEDILSWDLYLYSRAQGTVFGGEKEFIAAPRLDDLECVFAATKAFLAGENRENVTVLALFDNEEIGSLTRQGADSTFLGDVLERVALSCGKDREGLYRAIAGGFMLSADNAHAVHPDSPEEVRPHQPLLLKRGRGGQAQPPLRQRRPHRRGVPGHLPKGRGARAGVLQQLQDSRRRHLGQPVRLPCGIAHGGHRPAPAVHALPL